MTSIATKLDQVSAKIEALRQEMISHARVKMEEAFALLFDTYPEVKAIVWSGWIPYFNDGEPCEFTIYGVGFLKDDIQFDDPVYEDSDGKVTTYNDDNEVVEGASISYTEASPELKTDMQAISRFMNVNTELVALVYGEHHNAKVTRKGTEVTEYDQHD